MGAPYLTVRVDTSGTPFGGVPVWTDVTEFLEYAPVASSNPEWTWSGRLDELSDDAQPGRGSFTLNNTGSPSAPGPFTTIPGLIIATDQRVQILETYDSGSTTFVRADGYVDAAVPSWPGDGGSDHALLLVTFSSIESRLGTAKPLRSMYEQEVLLDNPGAFYPLNEPSTSQTVGNIAPAGAASVGTFLTSKYGGSWSLGADAIVADDVTSLSLSGGTTTATQDQGSAVQVPNLLSTAAFTVELVFNSARLTGLTPAETLLATIRNDGGPALQLAIFGSAGLRAYLQSDADNSGTGTNVGPPISSVDLRDGLDHHVMLTYTAVFPGQYLNLYLDGVATTDYTDVYGGLPPLTKQASARFVVGARLPMNDLSAHAYGFNGRLGMLAIYPGVALSAAAAARHYQAFRGFPGERSDQRYSRLAGYGGVATAGLPTGVALMGAQKVSGKKTVETLATVARTEGTLSYATKAGLMTFPARNARYNKTVDLSVTNLDIGPRTQIRKDRQGLHNTRTVTRQGGSAQSVTDAASVAQRGTIDGGSLEVAPYSDLDAYNNAKWRIITHTTDQVRVPELEIELFTQPQAFVESVLALDIGSLVQITSMPAQAPGGTTQRFFVEGGHEEWGPETWLLRLFTSPNNLPATLRADASASTLTKLDSGLKIGF